MSAQRLPPPGAAHGGRGLGRGGGVHGREPCLPRPGPRARLPSAHVLVSRARALLSLSASTWARRGRREEVFVTASQHTVRTPESSCLRAQGQSLVGSRSARAPEPGPRPPLRSPPARQLCCRGVITCFLKNTCRPFTDVTVVHKAQPQPSLFLRVALPVTFKTLVWEGLFPWAAVSSGLRCQIKRSTCRYTGVKGK